MIINSKMTINEFCKECSNKYGWNDGNYYPSNIITIIEKLKKKGFDFEEIESSHNIYKFISAPSNANLKKEITLKWKIKGKIKN